MLLAWLILLVSPTLSSLSIMRLDPFFLLFYKVLCVIINKFYSLDRQQILFVCFKERRKTFPLFIFVPRKTFSSIVHMILHGFHRLMVDHSLGSFVPLTHLGGHQH